MSKYRSLNSHLTLSVFHAGSWEKLKMLEETRRTNVQVGTPWCFRFAGSSKKPILIIFQSVDCQPPHFSRERLEPPAVLQLRKLEKLRKPSGT